MSATTTTTSHDFELPSSGPEGLAQAQLDEEAAELRDVVREAAEMPEDERLPLLAGLISRTTGVNVTTGQLYFTPADVLSWFARAAEMGCPVPRIRAADLDALFHLRRVPNATLREAYEERVAEGEEALATTLAYAIGAVSPGGQADTTYVLRLLGVTPAAGILRLFLDYAQAVAMADVLDLSYHDIGV